MAWSALAVLTACNGIFGIDEGRLDEGAGAASEQGASTPSHQGAGTPSDQNTATPSTPNAATSTPNAATSNQNAATPSSSDGADAPSGDVGAMSSAPTQVLLPLQPAALPPPLTGLSRGPELPLSGGLIPLESNQVGIDGAVGIFAATMGFRIEPTCNGQPGDCFEASRDAWCVTGHADEVVMGDYTDHWGGAIALQLLSAGGWQPAGVVGFSFRIEGPTIPRLRFAVSATSPVDPDTGPPTYCRELAMGGNGYADVLFSELRTECWFGTGETPAAEVPLMNIQWQIPAWEGEAVDFDFCVSELRPILRSP